MSLQLQYQKPNDLSSALALADTSGDSFSFIAGGTDLWVNYLQKNIDPKLLIDLSGIEELKKIDLSEDKLEIGTLVTLEDIIKNPIIKNNFPLLEETALSVATPVIRKTATLGGNLLCENRCYYYNQSEFWKEAAGQCLKNCGEVCLATGGTKGCFSKFVSDMAVALIALETQVEIVGKSGKKQIPLENIYTGDGIKPRNMSQHAILKKIILPANKFIKYFYRKLRARKTLEFTSLTVAITKDRAENIRIVLGGIAQKPLLLVGNSSTSVEEFIAKAKKLSKIVDNDMFPRLYRKEMMEVFIREGLGTNL